MATLTGQFRYNISSVCCICKKKYSSNWYEDREQASYAFSAAGWSTRGDGWDYCPKHRQEFLDAWVFFREMVRTWGEDV